MDFIFRRSGSCSSSPKSNHHKLYSDFQISNHIPLHANTRSIEREECVWELGESACELPSPSLAHESCAALGIWDALGSSSRGPDTHVMVCVVNRACLVKKGREAKRKGSEGSRRRQERQWGLFVAWMCTCSLGFFHRVCTCRPGCGPLVIDPDGKHSGRHCTVIDRRGQAARQRREALGKGGGAAMICSRPVRGHDTTTRITTRPSTTTRTPSVPK
jgi:hypothetical protein